jgi:hypothetical protein
VPRECRCKRIREWDATPDVDDDEGQHRVVLEPLDGAAPKSPMNRFSNPSLVPFAMLAHASAATVSGLRAEGGRRS